MIEVWYVQHLVLKDQKRKAAKRQIDDVTTKPDLRIVEIPTICPNFDRQDK